MAIFDQLISNLYSSEIEVAKSAAEELGTLRERRAVPYLLKVLDSENQRLVSAAAIALGEIGASEAREPLLERLRDKSTLGHRGSLVYALMYLDCSSRLLDIAALLGDPYYEVRAKALIVLRNMKTVARHGDREAAMAIFRKLAEQPDLLSEQYEDIEEAMEIVEELPEPPA